MDLAYAAGRAGGTMTGVLSAANEKAVELFISEKYVLFIHLPLMENLNFQTLTAWGVRLQIFASMHFLVIQSSANIKVCLLCRISYLDIFKIVELTCAKHRAELVASPSLEEIIHYDLWARDYAANLPSSSSSIPVFAWAVSLCLSAKILVLWMDCRPVCWISQGVPGLGWEAGEWTEMCSPP